MPIWEIERNGRVVGEIESEQPPDRKTVMRALAALDRQSVLPRTPSQPPAPEAPQPSIMDSITSAFATADPMGRDVVPQIDPAHAKEQSGEVLKTWATEVGPMVVTAGVLGLGGNVAGRMLPSMTRAGEKFQKVMATTKNAAVNTTVPGRSVARIVELSERGGAMPKGVRDLFKRLTDPNKGDLTYQEARDFYHNLSRLSADEFKRLTPVMRRAVGELRATLNEALENTAATTGQRETYKSAMKEYAQAARLKAVSDKLKKWALPAGAGGAVGVYALDKLTGGR